MKYIGITIGPIGDTLALAKSPAMLWYASSVFSRLAFLLCKKLKDNLPSAEILAPAISDASLNKVGYEKDGIGKYHDRITVCVPRSDFSKEALDQAIAAAKKEVAVMVSQDYRGEENADDNDINWLTQYFQTPYVIVDEEELEGNAILALSEYLDALEMMRTFNPNANDNVFSMLFGHEHEENKRYEQEKEKYSKRNRMIHECKMLSDVDNSQLLLNKHRFRDISSIADPKRLRDQTEKKCPKSCHYYAVIQADGDSMGTHLESLTNDKILDFSKRCIQYAASVSSLISAYGGMTVYAGGDDLLAIVPVIGNKVKNKEENKEQVPRYEVIKDQQSTVFDLCREIGVCFDQIVKGTDDYPTVSIGISVRYEKFPLYEALNAAAGCLFGVAKKEHKGKNYCAFDFQKHSGQEVRIAIPMEQLDLVSEIISGNCDSDTVNSIIYNLNAFKRLFTEAGTNEAAIKNVFGNLYDNGGQAAFRTYVCELAENYIKLKNAKGNIPGRGVRIFSDIESASIADIKAFEGILRIMKFIMEE